MTAGHLIVAAILLSPVLGVASAHLAGLAWIDTVVSGLGVVGATLLLSRVAMSGDLTGLAGWIKIDRVGAAWTLFVLVVALSVRAFSRRQLSGDVTRLRFHWLSAFVAINSIALCVANDLRLLILAALCSTITATLLVGVHGNSGRALRKMGISLLVADVAFLLGSLIVIRQTHSSQLDQIQQLRGTWLHIAATLLVVGALIRCAQVPLQGWLAGTLVAPTPVSALLHAGMVNAGGILLIRLSPIVSQSVPATIVGLVCVTLSMVFGLQIMKARLDVKGSLVWSTSAQMGFMLAQVLVGLGAAAAAHLIAHGAYKSSLFLSSGSTVEHREFIGQEQPRAHRWTAGLLTLGIVAIAVFISGTEIHKHEWAQAMIVAFAALTVYAVLVGPAGIRRGLTRATVTFVSVLAILTTLYLWTLSRFESFLSLGDATPHRAGVLAAIVVICVTASAWMPDSSWIQARSRKPLLQTLANEGKRNI